MRRTLLALFAFLLCALAACTAHERTTAASPGRRSEPPAVPGAESFPVVLVGHALPWCAVDGRTLPEDFVPVVANGRVFCTCSLGCAEEVRRDPLRVGAEVDRATIALQMRDYPLERCVVSGHPLGADAIEALSGSVLVRLCGDACRPTFDADPRPFLARLATARSAAYGEVPLDADALDDDERRRWLEIQRPELPSSLCASCGVQPTDGEEARELLLRGTLVRVCSPLCAERAHTMANEVLGSVQRAAFENQKRSYPISTCAVSGHELGPRAESTMIGLLLVRVCSPGCAAKLPLARESVASLLRLQRSRARAREAEIGTAGQPEAGSANPTPARDDGER